MREVRKQVDKLLGLSAHQRLELLSEIFTQGFEGADSSPNMVLMGRINMALHGDPKARVFRVANSLTSDIFVPESFDLILTNPPFKKGGVTEKDQADLLAGFRTDLMDGRPAMNGAALALGAKPDGKGIWKAVNSVDPAVLFIDRCLQLLKPGGRLLIVVPDGILCNSQNRRQLQQRKPVLRRGGELQPIERWYAPIRDRVPDRSYCTKPQSGLRLRLDPTMRQQSLKRWSQRLKDGGAHHRGPSSTDIATGPFL